MKMMPSIIRIGAVYLLSLSVLCMVSCKDPETLTPYIPDNSGPLAYQIKGLKDTSLERIGEVRYIISINRDSGKAEKIVLSAENLPKGMEVIFDPIATAEPSFTTTMVTRTTRTPVGEYQVRVRGAGPTSGIKSYNTTIKVLPYSNAALGLKGDFTESGQCSLQGPVNENVRIEIDEQVKNKIYIKGLFSGVWSNVIYAILNPADNTLTIPSQVQNAVTYEGDGTYDDDKVIINYTVTGVTFNETCSSTLTRN